MNSSENFGSMRIACCADHLRQRFLTEFPQDRLRPAFLTEICEEGAAYLDHPRSKQS
jgi:hypothetical protein